MLEQYANEVAGIFGISHGLVKIIALAIVVWLGWDAWPKVGSVLAALAKKLFDSVKSAHKDVPTKDAENVDPLDSLQSMTRWAVKKSSSEVLGKITALYADLQAQSQKEGK